ncbi:unnamed protein product [Moneuplotes crassus]|uniref:Calpain catalytic domain-containing protein n=1 Tax=Euplotes crassus TaxID=5936 RepID=A0AAD1XJJ9_EUPCR|nr:unnamed protein product [Moneuplotes crassus]
MGAGCCNLNKNGPKKSIRIYPETAEGLQTEPNEIIPVKINHMEDIDIKDHEESKIEKESSQEILNQPIEIPEIDDKKSSDIKINKSSQSIANPSLIRSRRGALESLQHKSSIILQNSYVNETMRSVLNFHPDDIIVNKNERRKKSATNSSLLKTFAGLKSKGVSPNPILESVRLLKNKRHLSEHQIIMVSQEMRRIFHKQYFSTGDWEKYAKEHPEISHLDKKEIERLDNLNDSELFKEVSQFMDPRDIISMFSIDKRATGTNIFRKDHDNIVQLSTLSTNPKKREQSKKQRLHKSGKIELEENFNNYSETYQDALLEEDEDSQRGPNEAMYIDVEKIPANSMLTFEESLQRQKEILDKSSKVRNSIMPIWDTRKHAKAKFYKTVENDYDETDDYKSNSDFPDYKCKCIQDMSENPEIMTKELDPSKIIMGKLKPSISFACALISIANYDAQFSKSIIGSLVYPNKSNNPLFSKSGIYGVKARFNGTQRLVLINDKLPYNSDSEEIFTTHTDQFVIQLLEKATAKIYGKRYSSISSNPSIEMHHFIGWIPEIVKFTDVNNKDNLWSRMKQNFKEGNIILGVNIANEEEEAKLYSSDTEFTHEDSPILAILDIREFKEHKLMKCANPSGGFTSFNIYKPNETHSLTGELIEPVVLPSGTTRKIESTFWLKWEDVLSYYTQINLCWNPSIYPFKKQIHSYWKHRYSPESEYPNLGGKFIDEKYCVEYCPQFVFTIPPHKDDFEVRIFLQRHMQSFDHNGDRFISFKLFSFEGYRAIYPDDNLRSFQYSRREMCSDVFIFENSTTDESYILAILKGDDLDKSDEVQFTLDVLSFIDIDIKELPEPVIEESYQVKGKWNLKRPGGDLLSEHSVNNPHYKLTVIEPAHVQIKAECDKNSIMVVIFEGGNKISETPFSHITKNKNPGCYSCGFSCLETTLDPGVYTVILCTEEISLCEKYRIVFNLMEDTRLSYSEDLLFEKIP